MKDILSLNNLIYEIMLFCVGWNGKYVFVDLKKYFVGVGVGMGIFCLFREGVICKRFFLLEFENDFFLICV